MDTLLHRSYIKLLVQSKTRKKKSEKTAVLTSTEYFTVFKARSNSFTNSSSHHWNNTPTPDQSEVFMLQVVIYYATNPDTSFVVTETSFSELRSKTSVELEAMLKVLRKQFIELYPDGKGINCFYTGIEVVPLTHAGSEMLSFDQGNPTLKSDDPGQTWAISMWFMNMYKNGMSPDTFKKHMNYIIANYDTDAADAMYERYIGGEDVEDTTASRLFAQSTFAKHSIDSMRKKEKQLRSESCVDIKMLSMFANMQGRWDQSVL